MPMSETELIERYFRPLGAARTDVVLGIGDDAAILQPPSGQALLLTTDALLEGAHFLPGAPPRSLGHRALAVNLSDIAAMGGTPSWALLSLNLPLAEEAWLREFATGFGELAHRHGVALVGGNLARGPLSITVQLAGLAPPRSALRRDSAQPGDALYVSGSVGDAAAGLAALRSGPRAQLDSESLKLVQRFEFPTPRVELGLLLRDFASACIDVSDGLYLDASRLLAASRCGAALQLEQLPLSPALRHLDGERAWQRALGGGEDYELCFTVPASRVATFEAAAVHRGQAVSRIGVLAAGHGLTLRNGNTVTQFSPLQFDHFNS